MFFREFGWTPEILLSRTMRELVAYSKIIRKTDIEERKFRATIAGMKYELPDEPPEIDSNVLNKIEEIERKAAQKYGFV